MTETINGVQQSYKAGGNFELMYGQNQFDGVDGVSVGRTTLPQYDNLGVINFSKPETSNVPQHANSDLFRGADAKPKLDLWA